ncbi:uncharacterized protein LOC126904320 [Daktulosphaira vitifoliae]|uniref:uncharacterized protein LOC126904320 n=1 Tax=Daktulosphaira vitifoliae TaxID=58002 RepID=UPI0021AA7FA8|nr:uncharacterized protein LOC126904320 [Daktulosphaira vitifoliae]
MLPTRLIHFFVLICLTNSSNKFKTTYIEDYDAEFNRIIRSDGWKKITSVYFQSPYGSKISVNKGFEDNPIIVKKDAALILSKVYEKLVGYFNCNFRWMTFGYNHQPNDAFKLQHYLKLVAAILQFEPLISCMARALKYLNCDDKNKVLNNLNKSLDIIEEIKIIDKKERSYESMNNIFVKYFDIVNTPVIQKFDAIVSPKPENFIDKYIEEINKLEKKCVDILSFNPYHPSFQDKVEEGVTMFCVNFGFKD